MSPIAGVTDTRPAGTTLASLPVELLTPIVLLLDKPSALSFGRTARRYLPIADIRILRDVDLTPGRLKPFAAGRGRGKETTRLEALMAALAEDESRYGRIRSLRIDSEPDLTNIIHPLLERVSDRLESLDITIWSYENLPSSALARLVKAPLTFSALKHIAIDNHVENLASFLCSLAPNLESLDVKAGCICGHDGGVLPEHAEAKTHPSVTRFTFTVKYRCESCYPWEHLKDVKDYLAFLPNLQRFCIADRWSEPYSNDYIDGEQEFRAECETTWERIMALCVAKPYLRELSWVGIDLAEYDKLVRYAGSPLSHLTHLHLDYMPWNKLINHIPISATIRSLYLNGGPLLSSPAQPTPGFTAAPTGAQAMSRRFARCLRASPQLGIIHWLKEDCRDPDPFEILEAIGPDQANGLVHSYRHNGSSELLHVRFFSSLVETQEIVEREDEAYDPERESEPVSDDEKSDLESEPELGSVDGSAQSSGHSSEQGGRWKRGKVSKRLPEPVWQSWTDYQGVIIPLEVIEEMRKEDGASPSAWRGRGVEVSEKSWTVLMEYHNADKGEQ